MKFKYFIVNSIMRSIGLMEIALLALFIGSCYSNTKKSFVNESESPDIPVRLLSTPHSGVIASDLKFYAWWWNRHDIEKGFDADNPPPKNSYIELNEWMYDGEGFAYYPDRFDATFQLANNTTSVERFKVLVLLSSRVDESREIMYGEDPKGESLDDILARIPWSDEQKIEEREIELSPISVDRVSIKNIDIRAVINRYNEKGRWPWMINIRVIVSDSKGGSLSQCERSMKVIPGD